MPVTPLRDSDPTQVGQHRLLGRLGQGGMGTVFLGISPDDRAVAVKVLRDGLADPHARRRFRQELDALRRVRGPHLVEVLDADVDADLPYLVTRFVPGRRLDDLVQRHGPLELDELLVLARGLADALGVLHGQGVVHRDLTPGNVLMLDGQPHVIDLGLAVAADVTALTRSGVVVGTPGYLAPEQVLGTTVTSAVDVHAWGATVAFAATGRPPYGTGRPEAVLYRLVHGEPDLAGVPDELADLVAACTAADPDRRPTAPALLERLGSSTQGRTQAIRLPHDVDATTALEAPALQPRELVDATSGPQRTMRPPGAVSPTLYDDSSAGTGALRMTGPDAPALETTRFAPPAAAPLPRHVVPWYEDERPSGPADPWGEDERTEPARPDARDQGQYDQGRYDQGRYDQGQFDQGPYDEDQYPQDPFPDVHRRDDDTGALAPMPDRTHPARALQHGATALAALAVLAAGTLLAPVLGVLFVLALLVGLRTVGRSSERLRDRRDRRGERSRDPVVTTLAAPWHLLLAAVDTAASLPLVLLTAAVPAGIVWLADPAVNGHERPELTIATGAVVGLVVGLRRRVHRQSRLLLRRTVLTLTPGSASAVALVLGLVLLAVLLLATAEGQAPQMWPLSGGDLDPMAVVRR